MQSYFNELEQVRYEGSQSTNPLAFHHYNPDEMILGKRMADHLRFAACYWHTFCWGGADMFGANALIAHGNNLGMHWLWLNAKPRLHLNSSIN